MIIKVAIQGEVESKMLPRLPRHQIHVLLCTETTVSNPPVVFFWVKYQRLSKVEIIQIPFFHILEKINENYDKK